MINKVAKLLLNSIKTNQPRQRIIRIAKILYKLAAAFGQKSQSKGGKYHSVMVDRFLQVFSDSDDITLFLEGKKYASAINFVKPVFMTSRNPRQKELLDDLNTIEIDELEDKIVRSNKDIADWLEAKFNIGVNPVKVKTRTRHDVTYSFGSTQHFGWRSFFRGLDLPVLQEAANELVGNIVENPTAFIFKKGKEYVSNIKIYDMYVTLVIGEVTQSAFGGRMDLITSYPNQKGFNPTFPAIVKEVVQEQVPVKEIPKPTFSVKPGILTPEEFLKEKLVGTESIPFKIWTKGTVYNDANTTPGILKYPKQLEKNVTLEGIAKIAKRIGVALKNSESVRIKVQMDCTECYLKDGTKSADIVMIAFNVKKNGNTEFEIESYEMSNSSGKQRSWWERDDMDSIR